MNQFDRMLVDPEFLGKRICDMICTLAMIEDNEFIRESAAMAIGLSRCEFEKQQQAEDVPSNLTEICDELIARWSPENTCEDNDES